jgi:tRNA threonylcarbamoyladenosine biosynthesis protein TsaE
MSAGAPNQPDAAGDLPAAEGFPYRRRVQGPAGTGGLGAEVAGLLRGGELILLFGDLGAGKTCFTQGLCRGLGIDQGVVSPTFTLVNTYRGRLEVHHLDFYRIEPEADLTDIGVPDILDQLSDGVAVAVVEWPTLLLPELGPEFPRLELLATVGPAATERIWHLRGVPETPESWVEVWAAPEKGESPC